MTSLPEIGISICSGLIKVPEKPSALESTLPHVQYLAIVSQY